MAPVLISIENDDVVTWHLNFLHTEHITGPAIVYMQSRCMKSLAGTLSFTAMHKYNLRVVPSHPHARWETLYVQLL